ncbi:MAG TPA: winged helix-turn-helix transcriptional regulator [Candidatus Cottocaccamicrobium excrementipullorum]|nr:winged helix-turn-helix transcriptional regulator [Candidatus Cottocaccamicrobium excrementipullorum]
MTTKEELRDAFHQCMPLFIALGDEVRLTIIEALVGEQPFDRSGLNVNQITEKTSLSRPAISHHLKILKEAGLVNVRQEGTANYYYLTIAESTRILMNLGFRLQEYLV